MLHNILSQQVIIQQNRNYHIGLENEAIKNYVEHCVIALWMISSKETLLEIYEPKTGDTFNNKLHNSYNGTGKTVKSLVFPGVRFIKDGSKPVVMCRATVFVC